MVDARKKPRTKTEPPPPPAPGHVYERSTHLADNGGVFSRRPLRFEPSVVFSFRGILHAAAANRTTTRPTGDDGSTTLTLKKKKRVEKRRHKKPVSLFCSSRLFARRCCCCRWVKSFLLRSVRAAAAHEQPQWHRSRPMAGRRNFGRIRYAPRYPSSNTSTRVRLPPTCVAFCEKRSCRSTPLETAQIRRRRKINGYLKRANPNGTKYSVNLHEKG